MNAKCIPVVCEEKNQCIFKLSRLSKVVSQQTDLLVNTLCLFNMESVAVSFFDLQRSTYKLVEWVK